MTDSNGATQAERPSPLRKPWHYAKSQEEYAQEAVMCEVHRGYAQLSCCESKCSARGSAGCAFEGERAAGSEAKEEVASAASAVVAATEPTEAEAAPPDPEPEEMEDEAADLAQDEDEGSDGDGLIDPSEPNTNIQASDCEDGDSEGETSATEAQPKPAEAPPVIEVAAPAPAAEEDNHQDLEPTTTPEPLQGTSLDDGGPTEHSASPARVDVDEEDVPDVSAQAPDVDNSNGVLELPRETTEKVPDSAPGKGLWSQLAAELGGDVGELSVEAVSPEHLASWHERATMLARRSVVLACAIGLALAEQKKELRHGQFKPWIADNCSFSYATANRYMRVARWASEKYHACDFSWTDMSLREVDRLLPSPGKKKNSRKKGSAEDPTPTSTAETASPADTGETPAPTTTSPETGAQTNAEIPADIDGCGETDHASGEDDTLATIDTSGENGNTTNKGDLEIEEKSVACVTGDQQELPESPDDTLDVEAAVAALTADIVASPNPQARSAELIERLATAAGLNAHATRRVILLRPVARGHARRRIPKKAGKVSDAAVVAEAESRPHRTLRFQDLVPGRRADA
jgi:hypothetical protein